MRFPVQNDDLAILCDMCVPIGAQNVREHHIGGSPEVQQPGVDGVHQRLRVRGFPGQGVRKVHQQQLSHEKHQLRQQRQQVPGAAGQIL